MFGKPVIKGTSITVQLIFQLMANGAKEAEILNDYPDLKKEDIKAAIYCTHQIALVGNQKTVVNQK